MGSATFEIIQSAENAPRAFDLAVRDDEQKHGKPGCSLAKKSSFVLASRVKLSLDAARALATDVYDSEQRTPNKYADSELGWVQESDGPAGCIPLDDGRFLFFGWAKS